MPIYTVDNTGGGTHTTIAAALAVAITGDTIRLTDGQTFAEGDLGAAGATGITVERTPGEGLAVNSAGDGPPVIDASGFSWAITYDDDWTIEGVEVRNASSHAWQPFAGNPTNATFRWLRAVLCGGLVADGGNGCKLELAEIDTCVGEVVAAGFVGVSANIMRGVLVYRSQGKLVASANNGIMEHCVWANGDAAATGESLLAGTTGSVVRNSIVYNPGTGCSGCSGASYDSNCVLLDDVTQEAYVGAGVGVAPGSNLIADPLFVDEANDDYHLALGSPAIGLATDGVDSWGIGDTLDLDGISWSAYGERRSGVYASTWNAGATALRALARGSHEVDLLATAAVWLPSAEAAHRWILLPLYDGPSTPDAYIPVRGARAEIDADDTRILRLRTDIPIVADVPYRIYFDAVFAADHSYELAFGGTYLAAAGVDFFIGGDEVPPDPDAGLVLTAESSTVPDIATWWVLGGRVAEGEDDNAEDFFRDLDVAIFDDTDGSAGWRIGSDGSYSLVGGVATIVQVVWNRLLTQRGELAHDLALGTRIRVKRPVLDLDDEARYLEARLADVPFVRAVRVTLARPVNAPNALDVTVEVATDLGLVRTRRQTGGPV